MCFSLVFFFVNSNPRKGKRNRRRKPCFTPSLSFTFSIGVQHNSRTCIDFVSSSLSTFSLLYSRRASLRIVRACTTISQSPVFLGGISPRRLPHRIFDDISAFAPQRTSSYYLRFLSRLRSRHILFLPSSCDYRLPTPSRPTDTPTEILSTGTPCVCSLRGYLVLRPSLLPTRVTSGNDDDGLCRLRA